MRDFTIECSINGRNYKVDHLASMQYSRHLHVLHDMKRLSAPIVDNERSLSDDDIDLLSPDDAQTVSVAVRRSFTVEGITALYAEQLRISDRMWKAANDASGGSPLRPCLVDVTVTGITADEFRGQLAGPDFLARNYVQLNPDHYFLHDCGSGTHSMETFGMYGGPTDMYITTDPEISAPVKRDADFSLLTAGYTTLASDGTNVNILALHQFKALDDGLAIKLGAFFPPMTPNEVVDGHAVHMAIEFWQMCKVVALALT